MVLILRLLRSIPTRLAVRYGASPLCHTASVAPSVGNGAHLAEDDSMDRADLPLLLASDLPGAPDARFPLDRIRLQKAIFLLTQRGPERWRHCYMYEPYNWGPYSSTLNSDVGSLIASDQLAVEPFSGSRYGSHKATLLADGRTRRAWDECSQEEREFLRRVKHYVTSRSFNTLLREVYAAYPDYASKSLFSG